MKNYMSGIGKFTSIAVLAIWSCGCVQVITINTMTERKYLNTTEDLVKAKITEWKTYIHYVDIETGEILDAEWAKGLYTRQPLNGNYRYGDYTIINREILYESTGEDKHGKRTGVKWLRYDCRPNKATSRK